MSNYSKSELIALVGQRIQSFQDATDELDEAVAGRLGLNRTDLRCLSVLAQTGAMTPSALADATGLTRAAMTTALDRMERAGYLRRVRDQDDRRSLRLELTPQAVKDAQELYQPMAVEGARMLQKFTAAELTAVLRILDDGRQTQRDHAKRIREMGERKK
jgi:DNA-binding MarR family transcriptional regulator